jgi:hypothetical protein
MGFVCADASSSLPFPTPCWYRPRIRRERPLPSSSRLPLTDAQVLRTVCEIAGLLALSSNYSRFSALLAELAGEPVSGLHLSAALSSATFLQALLYDPATALVGDSVTLASGAVSCVVGVDPKMSAAAGAALSAFAVLAELAPGLGFDELVRNITAAATSTTLWVGLDGVVGEGAQGTEDDQAAKGAQEFHSVTSCTDRAEGMLVRGLYEVWARSADVEIKARIAAFVSVQVRRPYRPLCVPH